MISASSTSRRSTPAPPSAASKNRIALCSPSPDPLGGQFGLFELEQLLAAVLEGILQGGFQDGIGPQLGPHEPHEETCSASLDSEADILQTARPRGSISGWRGRCEYFAALEIDQEPRLVGRTRAMIHSQQRGRRGID